MEKVKKPCKMARPNRNGEMEIYTCYQVREFQELWKSDFRKVNRTDDILKRGGKDRAYDDFCGSLDNFLGKCRCLE